MMGREVYPGQLYKHFKGNMYQIVTVAIHSETGEKLVIYQKLYGDYNVHARPYEMFLSEVDHEKYPDIKQKYRFELVERDSLESQSEEKPTEEEKVNTFDQLVKAVSDNKAQNEKRNEDSFEEVEESEGVDPRLLEFLDAETFDEKRRYVLSLKDDITNRLIDDMATAIDVTVDEGDIDKRFSSLLYCISTRAKYEVNR